MSSSSSRRTLSSSPLQYYVAAGDYMGGGHGKNEMEDEIEELVEALVSVNICLCATREQ
jgi:hypothetical protein